VIVVRNRADLAAARGDLQGSVGLVPTMGALHGGHLALVRAAGAAQEAVLATLFVNPTQFGPEEDVAAYPRDEAGDLALFEQAGVAVAFAPPVEEIYPTGFSTTVRVGELAAVVEGASRPGHFDGVATVVAKLLHLTRPDSAYFGQKDWQQTRVIRRLVEDLNVPARVIVVGTVREPDGLAMSSRNRWLGGPARGAATCLVRGLREAIARWDAGERGVDALEAAIAAPIRAEPMAQLDYASVRDAHTLRPVARADPPLALLVAARVGGVRLIDNALIGEGLVDVDARHVQPRHPPWRRRRERGAH